MIYSGMQTLAKSAPDFVCEVLERARDYEEYDGILSDFSYSKYLITDKGLKKADKIVPHSDFRDWFLTADPNFEEQNKEFLA